MAASLQGREHLEQMNLQCWEMLPRSYVKTVTENTSLRVIVICKV
jgi:hypothetical protein